METTFKAPYRVVIDEACGQEDCRTVMALMTNRRLNMSPGWRPSDAARAEAHQHETQGCDAYVAAYVPASRLFGEFTSSREEAR